MDARSWEKAIIVPTGRTNTAVSILRRKIAAFKAAIISTTLTSPRKKSTCQERPDEGFTKSHTHSEGDSDDIKLNGWGSFSENVHRCYCVGVHIDAVQCHREPTQGKDKTHIGSKNNGYSLCDAGEIIDPNSNNPTCVVRPSKDRRRSGIPEEDRSRETWEQLILIQLSLALTCQKDSLQDLLVRERVEGVCLIVF